MCRRAATAQSKLRDAVTQIYDMNLTERAARIERVQKNLAQMEEQLSGDRARRDQNIAEQSCRMMDEASRGPGARAAGATTKRAD